MQKGKPKRKIHPPLQQKKPGLENRMNPAPESNSDALKPGEKLEGKVALITGGDSGIGRAVAIAFARNGADIAICYLREKEADAQATKALVTTYGRKCLLL